MIILLLPLPVKLQDCHFWNKLILFPVKWKCGNVTVKNLPCIGSVKKFQWGNVKIKSYNSSFQNHHVWVSVTKLVKPLLVFGFNTASWCWQKTWLTTFCAENFANFPHYCSNITQPKMRVLLVVILSMISRIGAITKHQRGTI